MKNIFIIIICFKVFLCECQTSNTIKTNIRGYIKDSETGEPLAGAIVKIFSEKRGINVDGKGYYSVSVVGLVETKLEFSYLGYKSKQIIFWANKDTVINQSLYKDTLEISEVTVTKQRNFWGNMDNGRNVSSIDSKKIGLINSNNAADVLQACVSGVWSTNTSGAPGDHQKVRIRGVNTIFGCSDPLYIIDGVAVPIVNLHSLGIADLNTYDIENVTVLKDAASTALYGYQGGNGVVLIDTKQKMGSKISFSTKFGVQQVPSLYKFIDTKQFLATVDSSVSHKILTKDILNNYPTYNTNLTNINSQGDLFKVGVVKEYQLSGSGNIGKTGFYLSGNYYTQNGIIANSTYDKYTLSGKFNRSLFNKLFINLNFRGNVQENKNNLDVYDGSNLIIEGINKSPCAKSTPDSMYYGKVQVGSIGNKPIYRSVPSDRNYYDYKLTLNNANGIPSQAYPMLNNHEPTDSLINEFNYKLHDRTGTINLVAKYLITSNLFFNASSSVSLKQRLYSVDVENSSFPGYNNFMKSDERYVLFSQQLNLNYNKTLGYNELSIVTGYRNYTDNAYWNLDTIQNNYNSQQTWVSNSLINAANNASITRQIQSIALHVNYNYLKKYFVSILTNYEKLSINVAGTLNRLFPSVALSWDISHEKLLQNILWLNKLNLYANYGLSGNYPLNAFAKDYYSINSYYYFDNGIIESKSIQQIANHYLQPEIASEYNLGTNLSLFNNRIKLDINYYDKMTNNLIIMQNIPESYGGGKAMMNIGKVANTGEELNIEINPIRSQDFSWYSNFIISINKQQVKNLGNGVNKMEFTNSNDILIPQFEVALNTEVGVIKGYKYIGSWTAEDTKFKDKRYKKSLGGKYLSADTTKSSTPLSSNDFMTIGKTLPDYTWNWDNQLVYKDFSLDFLCYAVVGVNKFNSTRASTYMSGLNTEIIPFVQRGDASLTDSHFYQSSYFVEDASFIRLKRVTFAYQIKKKVFKYANLKLSLSLENFITITKYKGYDPEASIYTDNSFSDFGVDRGAYPNPKSIFFTVNIYL
jgi:TonB-linked SusC/RagA family outer membrane protein